MIFLWFSWNLIDFLVISQFSRRSGIFKLAKKDKSLTIFMFLLLFEITSKINRKCLAYPKDFNRDEFLEKIRKKEE